MKKIILCFIILAMPLLAQKNLMIYYDDNAVPDTGAALLVNLQAYWALEDTQDSHSTNELTNTGVTFTEGKVNNAGTFVNTENDYLTIAHNTSLDVAGSQDFTIALWVKLASIPSMGFITQSESSGAEKFRIFFYNSPTSDRPVFAVSNDGSTPTSVDTSAGGMTSGTWYLLVVWRDTTTDSIYIQQNNGTIYQAAFNNVIHTASNATFIGRLFTASTSTDMNGQIDEVAIWKRVLTAGERTYLYNNGTGRTYTGGKIQ